MKPTALALLLLLTAPALAQTKDSKAPEFRDYKVPVVGKARTTPTGMFRMGSYKSEKEFESEMTKLAKQGPNFAGHYVIIEVNCGSNCNHVIAIDVATGKRFYPDFISVDRCANDSDDPDFRWIDYQPDSELLVLSGSLTFDPPLKSGPPDGKCGDYYYVFHNGAFKTVHFEVWPDED